MACCRVEDLPQAFLESSHSVWLKTLAYLVLSRRERAVWDSMQATPKQRYDWLLSRCAAKDAVRMLIQERFGEKLCAADVEIAADADLRRWRLEAAAGSESGCHACELRSGGRGGRAECGRSGGDQSVGARGLAKNLLNGDRGFSEHPQRNHLPA